MSDVKTIVFQQGSGPFSELVAFLAEYHAPKMRAAGIEYRAIFRQAEPGPWHSREKLLLLDQVCKETPDGTRIAGMDADAVAIGETIFPPANDLKPWNMAGVLNNEGEINSGNLFVINCEEIRGWIRGTVAATRKDPGTWTDQKYGNIERRFHPGVKLQTLSPAWNCYANAKGTVVYPVEWMAFHDPNRDVKTKFALVKHVVKMVKEGRTFQCGGWK